MQAPIPPFSGFSVNTRGGTSTRRQFLNGKFPRYNEVEITIHAGNGAILEALGVHSLNAGKSGLVVHL